MLDFDGNGKEAYERPLKNRYCWQAHSENNLLTKSTNEMRPDLENDICYFSETHFDHSTAEIIIEQGSVFLFRLTRALVLCFVFQFSKMILTLTKAVRNNEHFDANFLVVLKQQTNHERC